MKIVYLLFFLVFVSTLRADTLSLESVLEAARKNNPEILAAKKRWDSLRANVRSERNLEKPLLSYESMYSGDEKTWGVSQEFPFPGKLYLKGRVAYHEALRAEYNYLAKEREILAYAKTLYARLYVTQRMIDLFEENTELMRHFSKIAESKYSIGKASQMDVLRAQVELSKMLNMLLTLGQEKETIQVMLNSLLNQPPESSMGDLQEPSLRKFPYAFAQLEEIALKNRPELLSEYHHKLHAGLALRSARLEYLPDIMTEYKVRSAVNPAMDNTKDFMVGVTLPLWFGKQLGSVQMAKAEQLMSEAEYDSMKNMTRSLVKELLVKMETKQRLAELYQTSVIPQAQNAFEVALSAYRSDKAGFLELLDVQRSLLQFRADYYQSLAEYEENFSELERVVGQSLEEEKP